MIGDFFYLVERNVTCGGREMVFTNLIGVDLRLRMVSKHREREQLSARDVVEKKTLTLSAREEGNSHTVDKEEKSALQREMVEGDWPL